MPQIPHLFYLGAVSARQTPGFPIASMTSGTNAYVCDFRIPFP